MMLTYAEAGKRVPQLGGEAYMIDGAFIIESPKKVPVCQVDAFKWGQVKSCLRTKMEAVNEEEINQCWAIGVKVAFTKTEDRDDHLRYRIPLYFGSEDEEMGDAYLTITRNDGTSQDRFSAADIEKLRQGSVIDFGPLAEIDGQGQTSFKWW